MSIKLFTNVAASYGLYKGLPNLKRIYRKMENSSEESLQKKMHTFIHLHIEPSSISSIQLWISIEKYQWVAHLIYYGIGIAKMYRNTNPIKLYLIISLVTALGLGSNEKLLSRSMVKVKELIGQQLFLYYIRDLTHCLDQLFE